MQVGRTTICIARSPLISLVSSAVDRLGFRAAANRYGHDRRGRGDRLQAPLCLPPSVRQCPMVAGPTWAGGLRVDDAVAGQLGPAGARSSVTCRGGRAARGRPPETDLLLDVPSGHGQRTSEVVRLAMEHRSRFPARASSRSASRSRKARRGRRSSGRPRWPCHCTV